MIEVRMHGRGGQGAVLASLLLAHAAHRCGYHVQVFPEFGVERRGVPVTAFARLDRRPIRLRTRVLRPDHVLILDPALAHYLPLTDGLQPGGSVVMNAAGPEALEPFARTFRLAWVDGSAIAARHKIGTATAPIVNTTMVGAFARVTGLVGKDDVAAAMEELFGAKAAVNRAAAFDAYDAVQVVHEPATAAAGV
ncbi:MAG: 2-oxoacid:acceptor oxidoreductase family protein [Planctomycetes bacterium]|nr:2-oxoacid:acceptor oxidoreductase family protein [Planctomycetota bacterium]